MNIESTKLNQEAFNLWVEYKSTKSKKISKQAQTLAINKLIQHDKAIQLEMVNNSIMNGWKGLVEPKSTNNSFYAGVQDDRKAYIEYFDNMLNIKVGNKFIYADMIDELEQIDRVGDIASFKDFIKSNLKSVEVSYLTGIQKFMHLSKLYKEKTLSKIDDGIEYKAMQLKNKLVSAISKNREHLLNDKFEFKFMLSDGDKFFSDKELFILDKLDKKVIHKHLNDEGLLEYDILKVFKKESDKLKTKRLACGVETHRAIQDLTKKAIKKIS